MHYVKKKWPAAAPIPLRGRRTVQRRVEGGRQVEEAARRGRRGDVEAGRRVKEAAQGTARRCRGGAGGAQGRGR